MLWVVRIKQAGIIGGNGQRQCCALEVEGIPLIFRKPDDYPEQFAAGNPVMQLPTPVIPVFLSGVGEKSVAKGLGGFLRWAAGGG